MSYKNYQHQLDQSMSQSKIRKTIRAIFGKKIIDYEVFFDMQVAGLLKKGVLDDDRTDFLVLISQENNWVSSGSPTIFIENQELASSLYLASFDIRNNFNVETPYKTFSLSFPENTIIHGITVSTGLVSIMTRREFIKMSSDAFGIDDPLIDSKYDELCLSVNINDGRHICSRRFSSLSTYDDPAIAKNENSEPLEAVDILSKIALSMCIYNSATLGEKLIRGYPESAVTIPKGKNKTDYKGFTLRATEGKNQGNKSESGTRKITKRIPFFRNLRAPRYYKGKHKNKPLGSRWIWIKEIDISDSFNTLLS